MGKILCLDYGTKRVGFAIGDESERIAFPRGTLSAVPWETFRNPLENLVRGEGITKILIGLPYDSDNKEYPIAKKIRTWGEKIHESLKIPVEYIDEFGSTNEALSKIPFRKKRREKGFRDTIAAQVILQRYLDEVRD